MSARTRAPHARHGADPWWGGEPEPLGSPPAAVAERRAAPRAVRRGIGWTLLRIVLAPLAMVIRIARQSPRVRWLALRLAILTLVLVFLACSVGVILVNNVVIGRTAELGELDSRRRELRRDNAMLGAEAARLRARPVIAAKATKKLGMVRTPTVPNFIYLQPGSRTLTDQQIQLTLRRQAAARERRAAAAAAAADARRERPSE